MTRVLVVEDDAAIARAVGIYLRANSLEVRAVATGRLALDALASDPPELVLLDLGLPDLDGVEVLRRIRGRSDVPVVVLTARDAAEDIVEALDLGADDYVTKPFGVPELLARIRAALRRPGPLNLDVHGVAGPDFQLDFDLRAVHRADGTHVHLTPLEWRIVAELSRHVGQVVPHARLLRAVWGPTYATESHYLRVYLNQIRRKLEPDPGHPTYFRTEPGVGYQLVGVHSLS